MATQNEKSLEGKTSTTETTIPKQYLSIQELTENYNQGGPVPFKPYSFDSINETATSEPEDKWAVIKERKIVTSGVLITGNGTTLWDQVGEVGLNLKNGPYYQGGRDNKMYLKNSTGNSKTIASYTYAGGNGELLEFEVTTEFAVATAEVGKSSDINPDTKEVETVTTQTFINNDAMYKNGKLLFDTYNESPLVLPVDNTYVDNPLSIPFVNSNGDTNIKTPNQWQELSKKSYPNKEAAQNDMVKNYVITEEDVKAYMATLRSNFDKLTGGVNENTSLENLFKEVGSLPQYIIKQTAYIKYSVNPSSWSNLTLDSNNRTAYSEYQIKAHQEKKWRDGINVLSAKPNITVNPRAQLQETFSDVDIIEEIEVEIPISGALVIASSSPIASSGETMVNKLVKGAETRVKAKAKVLGRPSLEEGMNIEILNVSSRYSGVWNITSITHEMDSSGYYCSMEFIQKSTPINVNQVKTSINTQKYYTDLNKVAKEAIKTESYKRPNQVAEAFLKWRENNGKADQNYIIVVDNEDPTKFEFRKASSDFKPEAHAELLKGYNLYNIDGSNVLTADDPNTQ